MNSFIKLLSLSCNHLPRTEFITKRINTFHIRFKLAQITKKKNKRREERKNKQANNRRKQWTQNYSGFLVNAASFWLHSRREKIRVPLTRVHKYIHVCTYKYIPTPASARKIDGKFTFFLSSFLLSFVKVQAMKGTNLRSYNRSGRVSASKPGKTGKMCLFVWEKKKTYIYLSICISTNVHVGAHVWTCKVIWCHQFS